ncbi:DUF3592 domain-containing protein [Inhella sp.]|uniref:DUF3592 domain-containing protein n=1 Tax=Inhella sp. TaxID=1921806 RepID=UPI0035B1D8CB
MQSWLMRLPGLLFSGVFMLAFGLVGIFFGIKPTIETLAMAWTVQGWQAVPAEVLHAQLHEHRGSKGSTTYRVEARYRYVIDDQAHESERIGLDESSGSDNIGDWHQRWADRLQTSQAQNLKVLAYVDPANSARAVLEPHIRWPMLFFRLPFALVFTGVGLGAGWAFIRICRGQPAQPEIQRKLDTRGGGAAALGLFAFFWCGLCLPMVALVWSDGDASWVAKLVISVFGLIGIGLAVGAWKARR